MRGLFTLTPPVLTAGLWSAGVAAPRRKRGYGLVLLAHRVFARSKTGSCGCRVRRIAVPLRGLTVAAVAAVGRVSVGLLTITGLLALPADAGAISRGAPDTSHPMVAAVGAFDPESGLVFAYCNATLVSDTVLVTAGHCVTPQAVPPVELLRVNFAADASPDSDGWQPVAAVHAHPQATFVRGSIEDVGVVVLPSGAAPDVPHATLPTSARLSALADHGGLIGESFDLVGYGCDHVGHTSGAKSVVCQPPPVRKFATAPFGGLTKKWLTLRLNGVATDEGGTCRGDSGGPAFLPGTLEVVAVTTGGGGPWCRENGYYYRLDTETARSFLAAYIDLP